jgi:PilZ domain-containing protein
LNWRAALIERRIGKRFDVHWPVRVEGGDGDQLISGMGTLRNISSGGASFELPREPTAPVSAGMELDVYIKLPFKKDNWMKYTAKVLRVEDGDRCAAAVRFEGARPKFALR